MTTAEATALGLVIAQYVLVVIVLRYCRSFGSLTEKRQREGEQHAECHLRELELMKLHMGTLKQLVKAREELQKREIA